MARKNKPYLEQLISQLGIASYDKSTLKIIA
jgi:hypothetical protein